MIIMKTIVIFALVYIVSTSAERCPGVFYKERYYTTDILKEGINKLHQLSLHRNNNTLYFIFELITDVPSTAVGYLNLDTNEVGVINEIRNATSIAIDQKRDVLYIGSKDGVFEVHPKYANIHLIVRRNVGRVFFKGILYFIDGAKDVYKYEDGYINYVKELQGIVVDDLIIDDDNNMFFVQNRKLFRIKMGTRAVNTHEMYTVDVISVDQYNRPFVSATDGLYIYNKYKFALDKISGLKNLKGLTFNNMGEPYYGVSDLIVKLNLKNPLFCNMQ